MKRSFVIEIICFLIALLFAYTAVSKLLDFPRFKTQILSQALPSWLAIFLLWTLPVTELLLSVLLMFRSTRYIGLHLSLLLMILFTAYIALVLSGYYDKVPCSCGGVLGRVSWEVHFSFNIFYLLLSSTGIYLANRERRSMAES